MCITSAEPSAVTRGRTSALGAAALCMVGLFAAASAQAADPLNDEDKPAQNQSANKKSADNKSPVLSAVQEKPLAEQPRDVSPPPPPKADQQEPRPYVPPVELQGKERHVKLIAVAGPWLHGFNGKGASTSIGPVWGASVRLEPYRWLGFRLTLLRGNQPVTPDLGVWGSVDTQVHQPDFKIIHWTMRMEPTWQATKDLLLWAGVGLGWARSIVPEATIGNLGWRSAERACVYVEGQWAMGAQYELIHDWLLVDLDLSTGFLGYQSGTAHETMQAFTPEGHRTHLGGYPDFSHKLQALFGIGVIL
jgi:hypothetical protein